MTTPSFLQRHRQKAVPAAAALALAVAALVFRVELIAWFTGNTAGEGDASETVATRVGGISTTGGAAPSGPTHSFSSPALDPLLRALAAYERVRAALAQDRVAGLAADAEQVAGSLRDARAAEANAPQALIEHLDGGAAAADALARAAELTAVRSEFSTVSRHLVALIAADPMLSERYHVYECTMTRGFNQWIQSSEQLANPYQGPEMLTCGSEIDWAQAVGGAVTSEHVHDLDEIAHYTCPMHTWVKEAQAGICPDCGMDLISVTKQEVSTGVLRIDRRRRQLIGLRIGEVELRNVTLKIRAIGKVVYDESRLADVTLKYGGWIQKLKVDTTGEYVRKGQTLFSIYSPDLYAAQQEYLLALKQKQLAKTDAGRSRADALLVGATERLRLWDIGNKQLAALRRSGKARQYIPIPSPASGYVVDKNVVEGAAIKPGERLFRVAGLDRVWVEAEVYEQDIAHIKQGMEAKISLSHVPGKSYPGVVSFVYPYLDKMSRTSRVRIVLPNRDLELKPDMYANVDFTVELGERLMVPEPAILYSGPRRIVFVDLGDDKLRPKVIDVGVRSDSYYEVRSGLNEGDRVVISGNFLLSSESRLKSATGLW